MYLIENDIFPFQLLSPNNLYKFHNSRNHTMITVKLTYSDNTIKVMQFKTKKKN